MAIALYFAPPVPMTAQQYDECITRLNKAGARHPSGRTYHACFGTGDSVSVFDVWTSREAFEKFGATLMPILAAIGVNPGEPRSMAVHNVIVPPAKAPSLKRGATKVRPIIRRLAAKKGKKGGRAGKKR